MVTIRYVTIRYVTIRYDDDKVKLRNSSFPNPTKMISSDKPFHSNDFKVPNNPRDCELLNIKHFAYG